MEIFGHRGAGGEAPENTIAGCQHAISRGIDRIEVDLRLSADGQLVVIHDRSVNRTCYAKGAVKSFTAGELSRLDARKSGPPWPRKKDCGVPTLKRLLEQTPSLSCYQLEVKSGSKAEMNQVANKLLEFFPHSRAAKKIVVTSANTYLLEVLRDIAPHIRLGIVAQRFDALGIAEELEIDYYCSHWSSCTPYLVRQLRKLNVHISVWTVNDPQTVKSMLYLNVDSLITDYPSMVIPLLASLQR